MNNFKNFSQKDQICHSLIEATIFKHESVEFIDQLLTKLESYNKENGYNMIVDILFIKYLKMLCLNTNLNKYRDFNLQMKVTSQYHVGFICFIDKWNDFAVFSHTFVLSLNNGFSGFANGKNDDA